MLSDLHDVLHTRMPEAREKCCVSRNGGNRRVLPPPHPCCPASLLSAFRFALRFTNTVFTTKPVRSLLCSFQLWRQEVAKTIFWGWDGAWKSYRRAAGPPQDRFPFPSECLCHADYKRTHCGAVTGSRAQKRAARRALFPGLLLTTGYVSLDHLHVLKLIGLFVCRVINELIGNLVGHLYFFLMFRYPMDLGGRNFLSTPQFL